MIQSYWSKTLSKHHVGKQWKEGLRSDVDASEDQDHDEYGMRMLHTRGDLVASRHFLAPSDCGRWGANGSDCCTEGQYGGIRGFVASDAGGRCGAMCLSDHHAAGEAVGTVTSDVVGYVKGDNSSDKAHETGHDENCTDMIKGVRDIWRFQADDELPKQDVLSTEHQPQDNAEWLSHDADDLSVRGGNML